MVIASGLALCGATVPVVGFLSAVAIPAEYFAYFGRQHSGLALFLISTVSIAIPLAAIGAVWCSVTLRFFRLSIVSGAALCLAGYLLGVFDSYVQATVNFLALEVEGKVPFSVFLRSAFPWWNVPVLVAVPLGILGAAKLRARSLRSVQ